MTRDEAKKHFDIKPCTNKFHVCKIGNLNIGLQIASNGGWVDLTQLNNERKHYFSFTRYKSPDDVKFYAIIIWKLQLIWGLS
jgi:hypothetical protein